MGYTHYWNYPALDAKKFAIAAKQIKLLIDMSGVNIAGGNGEGSPIVNDDEIVFNGVGDDSHETFAVDLNGTGFEFCKTAVKPYDIVVCGALVILKHHFGDEFKVSSDGELDDFQDAIKLVTTILGKKPKFKFEPDEDNEV